MKKKRTLSSGTRLKQILGMKAKSEMTQFHPLRKKSTNSTGGIVLRLQDSLKRQKSVLTVEVADEKNLQHNLIDEIAELTHRLKLETERISNEVRIDRVKLESLYIQTYGTKQEIARQRARTSTLTNNTFSSSFGSIISMLFVVILFSVTHFFIRLFPSLEDAVKV